MPGKIKFMVFVQILIATFLISLCVWAAVLFLFFKKETLSKITMLLVSLSAGALIGGAFLHLLPEASEGMEAEKLFLVVLSAFVGFFLIEKLFHWRHCHKENCEIHTFGYMNLVGDFIHNFIDGLIIAGAFVTDIRLGLAASLAVALHEIPQEISDFGVLLHGGFSVSRALIFNFLSSLAAVVGVIVALVLGGYVAGVQFIIASIAIGGFIYIAGSDLIPELQKHPSLKSSLLQLLTFIIGIVIMAALLLLE